MKLLLSHGYPHPMPENLTEAEESRLRARILYEIKHFEQKYTTTVEFKTAVDAAAAHAVTGWPYWGQKLADKLALLGPEPHHSGSPEHS